MRDPNPTSGTQANHAFIARWMLASAFCVVLTLVVGGITRLTESGLSITEWKPVSGVLPPMDAASWQAEFERYLQIPEARTVHRGISLEAFKSLYWWEWLHRVVARVAGLVIALPWLVLVLRRRIPRGLGAQLALLPVLAAAQGVLGWYMVRSGLSERTDVSQYRLVAHLSLALLIYVLAVRIWFRLRLTASHRPQSHAAVSIAVLSALTIVSGGFVAGLDAGHIYNTFPLMGSGLVPPGYGQLQPAWRNLFENPAAVQFNHRLLAVVTAGYVIAQWWRHRVSPAWHLVLLAALLQVTLGLSTLLLNVPVSVAALHQLGAVLLLTAALRAAHLTHQSPSVVSWPPTSSRTTADTMLGA